jgi:hypothetical protein
MADHEGDHETLVEKILEKIHDHDDSSSSSSSDSDDGKSKSFDSAESKIFRLFGREKPLHKVLGGGKCTLSVSLYIYLYGFVCTFYLCINLSLFV